MSVRNELVARFGLTERTDNYTDRPYADLWSGSGVASNISHADDGSNRVKRTLGWKPNESNDEYLTRTGGGMVEEWCDWPYRIVWRVPDERLHVTFCEGDVSVLQARDAAGWDAIEASAAKFYRDH